MKLFTVTAAVIRVFRYGSVKNIDAPMLTRVWQELECRIDVCRVTRGEHIEHL
jgi:DNA-binding Xre family transcriptional regulator